MKKLIILLFGVVILKSSSAQKVTFTANTNGIGLVPAFSLSKPAGLIFLTTNLTKNLEFSPDFAFNLKDGQGWFLDTWLRWNQPLDSVERWVVTAGIDWSIFFQDYTTGSNGNIVRTLRYPTFQGKLKFAANAKNKFIFDYWYTSVVEKSAGVRGHYLSFVYSHSQPLKKFTLENNLNTFYLNYSDGTEGFGCSFDAKIKHEKSGLFLGFQVFKPLTLTTEFNKNFFVGVTRKMF